MNLINTALIDLLLSAAETLRNETCRILKSYRTKRDYQKEISTRYKDETAYFQQEQSKLAAIAREEIAAAEKTFSAKVADYTKQMEEQLKKHLSDPVNSQFREKLSMISDFGIQPEPIEIDDLLRLNNGNQTGLSALGKVLEKVDSPYLLKYHTTKDFIDDIATIKDIVRNLKYIPAEYHVEGYEVYKGQTADFVYPNGARLGSGVTFDSITLIQYATAFESSIEKIKGMKDIWTADCSYETADATGDEATAEQELKNEFLKSAGLPAEKINRPTSATRIEESPMHSEGMEIARQLGERQAKARNTLQELIELGKTF